MARPVYIALYVVVGIVAFYISLSLRAKYRAWRRKRRHDDGQD